MTPHSRTEAPVPAAPERPRVIRLLDVEPDFARGVDPREAEQATLGTLAVLVKLAPGPWEAPARSDDSPNGPFAALVVGGLLARDIVLADRVTTQLVGAGDVIPLGAWGDGAAPFEVAWRAAADSELAILDARFLAAAQHWPWLGARLVERSLRWADRAAVLQAISQLGRVDLRLVALFWHLADRWGRVGPQGVMLPLRLTHETLGRLVGAQRPTVTLALRDLREQGAVLRHGAGWLLAQSSRDLLVPAERELPREDGLGIADGAPIQPVSREQVTAVLAQAAQVRDQARAGREDSLLARADATRRQRERTQKTLPPLD